MTLNQFRLRHRSNHPQVTLTSRNQFYDITVRTAGELLNETNVRAKLFIELPVFVPQDFASHRSLFKVRLGEPTHSRGLSHRLQQDTGHVKTWLVHPIAGRGKAGFDHDYPHRLQAAA